jgi:tol-pal system protein YbgF
MGMRFAAALMLGVMIFVTPRLVWAQDNTQTLADIRQELNVLFVEVQRLKREMSTTGAPSTSVSGGSVLDRVSAIEAELQRLTARTETLEHRVDQVVKDGTNRIGDLEFRLVELEGGDVSQLGETTTLGGPVPAAVMPSAATGGTSSELAVGEQADFAAAKSKLDAGDFVQAAAMFAVFDQSYPGSPLAAEAALRRGEALSGAGDTREAARAYLQSYSTDPTGPVAADAVLRLGVSLGALGKSQEACVTLGEVAVRYPNSNAVGDAQKEMVRLGCS